MGWDFCQAWTKPAHVKQATIDNLVRSGHKVLASAAGKRNHFWLAVEKDGKRMIFVARIGKDRRTGWYGSTVEHEGMGPFFYDCPVSVMAEVKDSPPCNEYAAKWRAKVQAPRTMAIKVDRVPAGSREDVRELLQNAKDA